MEARPLLVIVGPTASGKTALAINIAKERGGEVISADSRAIYMGMDIGAAKPTMAERGGVPHWGFDLVEPGGRFTAADFKQYAITKINEVRSRGNIPLLVGGTGLYVDAVIFDYDFPVQADPAERDRWDAQPLDELYKYCLKNNIKLPENYKNKRYVVNAIIRNGHNLKRRFSPVEDTIVVGIATPTDVLRTRINARIEQIFADGVIDEANALGSRYGWDNDSMKANIYPLVRQYLNGELTLEEAKRLASIKDWHLAKRQLTWLRRNEHIKWLPVDDAYTYITRMLDNLNNL